MYSLFVSSSLGLWAWASSIKLMSVTGLTGEDVPCKLKSEPYLQLSNGKVQLYYLMAQDSVVYTQDALVFIVELCTVVSWHAVMGT